MACAWGVLGLVLVASATAAQQQQPLPQRGQKPRAPATRGSATETARAHFKEAVSHYAAGRFREAIAAFQRSLGAVPNPDLHFNIARAYEQLGELAAAADHYAQYLRGRPDAVDREEVELRISSLRGRLSSAGPPEQTETAKVGELALEAAEPGAVVRLDGRVLGRGRFDKLLTLAPGVHWLEADKAEFVPLRAEVEVRPAVLSAAYVDLQPLRMQTDVAPEGARTWTWIAAGAGALALVACAASGVAALRARDAGEPIIARDWLTVSNIALGATIGLGIGSVVLYFEEPGAGAAESRAAGLASLMPLR